MGVLRGEERFFADKGKRIRKFPVNNFKDRHPSLLIPLTNSAITKTITIKRRINSFKAGEIRKRIVEEKWIKIGERRSQVAAFTICFVN